uniref:Uncharacterized protein n=1 Tax=uncultured Caudovirales phage TaxID=2100421 RepID=A0A6J5LAE3_9CAUD|nr:hypothetical protein UFOVP114_79 [uncultured Caudovirales phage]
MGIRRCKNGFAVTRGDAGFVVWTADFNPGLALRWRSPALAVRARGSSVEVTVQAVTRVGPNGLFAGLALCTWVDGAVETWLAGVGANESIVPRPWPRRGKIGAQAPGEGDADGWAWGLLTLQRMIRTTERDDGVPG